MEQQRRLEDVEHLLALEGRLPDYDGAIAFCEARHIPCGGLRQQRQLIVEGKVTANKPFGH